MKSEQLGATAMNALPRSGNGAEGRDVRLEVRDFVLKTFPIARKRQITNSDPLLESGLVDSQGVLEVVGFIEREFAIVVEDEELSPENFQTIDRIATFTQNKSLAK